MIYHVPTVKYKKLEKLSPSQFYAALQCPYKMILAHAYGNKPLLALSPNAYFGSVLHKLIESITRGKIQDEATFNEHWEKAIQEKDKELVDAGLQKFTPLRAHIKDIGLKKLQTLAYVHSKGSRQSGGNSSMHYQSEMFLHDHEGKVSGRADLVVESPGQVAIYDFKTGNITQQTLDESGESINTVKAEYEYQLKVYAYLYFLMKGKYPDKLFLVALDKSIVEITFTPEQCFSLYKRANGLLEEMNACIGEQNFTSITHCSQESCRFCLYRPACGAYRQFMEKNEMPTQDVTGELSGFKVFLNGNTCAYVTMPNGLSVVVSGFSKEQESGFQKVIGKGIILYNIKKSRSSPNVEATKFTTLYSNE